MELFRDANVDWLGKKWYFLGFSLIFSVAGVLSMLFWHGIPQGVDFKGGTQITVPFDAPPNEDHLRHALDQGGVKDATIQRISTPTGQKGNDVIISLPEAADQQHDAGRVAVEGALNNYYHDSGYGKPSVQIVGPTAGKQLQRQAELATIYSLIGMLVYLWFRFELIYGVAAVVAVFHDTLITVGAFSLTNKEITLTVIAAILTLIGYSMNDTIVVFDRIRENLALSRRETLSDVVNRSINQTLSSDRDLVWPDFLDGAESVPIRRSGSARLLLRAGHRDSDRDLFVDRGCGPDAGGLPGLAEEQGQDRILAGEAGEGRNCTRDLRQRLHEVQVFV